MNMACYKSALIDLDRRWANKGQVMNSYGSTVVITGEVQYIGEGEDPKDNIDFQVWEKAYREVHGQPDRLRRVDTCTFKSMKPFTEEEIESTHKANGLYPIKESEAIVGSANIDEIAELNRND